MAVCLWGMETNHCCLEVRMCVRSQVKTDIALCRSLIPTNILYIIMYYYTIQLLENISIKGIRLMPLLRTYHTVWQNWQSKESYI